ncbi:hypothetical protein ACFQV8_28580 [Pseudonocardia benzenivorans]
MPDRRLHRPAGRPDRRVRSLPGDLDEAVGILLDQDWAETDGAGTVDPADHGFDRVARFRQGFTGGPATCGL